MRRVALALLVSATIPVLVIVGCKKKQEEPAQQYPGYGTQQPGYGTQQPGYGTQQPGYGTQQPGYGTTQPTAQPTAQPTVAPTAATGLSTPGPAALPCQTDATCVTAKCHPDYQKCIFPCQTDNDCIAPNMCIVGTGLCAPSLGVPAQ